MVSVPLGKAEPDIFFDANSRVWESHTLLSRNRLRHAGEVVKLSDPTTALAGAQKDT